MFVCLMRMINPVPESQCNTDIHEDIGVNDNVELLAKKIVHDLVEADDVNSKAMEGYDMAHV